MAIRRFKQIGTTESNIREYPIFSEPEPPVNPGDIVVLSYTNGKVDKLIIQQSDYSACDKCAYGRRNCPAYIREEGTQYCIFSYNLYGVRIDNVLEEL